MLAVNKYDQSYVDDCRSRMKKQLAAYDALISAATGWGKPDPALGKAVDAFEPSFFGHLVLVLDDYFVHRTRAIEGKDGNALNEVRLLCSSMLLNGNVLTADKTMKFDPAKSVLKLQFGDQIRIDRAAFRRLFTAFFAEIEKKFV